MFLVGNFHANRIKEIVYVFAILGAVIPAGANHHLLP